MVTATPEICRHLKREEQVTKAQKSYSRANIPEFPDNEMARTKHNRKHALDHTDTIRREAAQACGVLAICSRQIHGLTLSLEIFRKALKRCYKNVSSVRDGGFMEESFGCLPSY